MSPSDEEAAPPREGRPHELLPGCSAAGYREAETLRSPCIPNHPLDPSEADLRLVTNTLPRERPHWWLSTAEGRHQREFLDRRDAA